MIPQADTLPHSLDVDDADEDRVDVEGSALAREVWAKYGDGFAQRLADLEAGKHPYQQSR